MDLSNCIIVIYIHNIFGPIIIQLMLRRTGAWLRRTGAWYFIEVYEGVVFFDPPPCLFDLPRVFLTPHERNPKWNSKETLKKPTWMFENLDKIFW